MVFTNDVKPHISKRTPYSGLLIYAPTVGAISTYHYPGTEKHEPLYAETQVVLIVTEPQSRLFHATVV